MLGSIADRQSKLNSDAWPGVRSSPQSAAMRLDASMIERLIRNPRPIPYSTASALEPRSALNPAIPHWLANASCSNEWAFTTSACVPVREKTWTDVLRCSRR